MLSRKIPMLPIVPNSLDDDEPIILTEPPKPDIAEQPAAPLPCERRVRNSILVTEQILGRVAQFQLQTIQAVKEDVCGWFEKLFEGGNDQEKVNEMVKDPSKFLASLSDGIVLCHLCQKLDPDYQFKIWENADDGTFFARDNIAQFLKWIKKIGVTETFETDDLALKRSDKTVAFALLDVARHIQAYRPSYQGPLPMLVKFENEIRLEEELQQSSSNNNNNTTAASNSLLHPSTNQSNNSASTTNNNTSTSAQHVPTPTKLSPQAILEAALRGDKKLIKEGMYDIGNKRVHVRRVNTHIMVRTGGGWKILEEFILSNFGGDVAVDIVEASPFSAAPLSARGGGGGGGGASSGSARANTVQDVFGGSASGLRVDANTNSVSVSADAATGNSLGPLTPRSRGTNRKDNYVVNNTSNKPAQIATGKNEPASSAAIGTATAPSSPPPTTAAPTSARLTTTKPGASSSVLEVFGGSSLSVSSERSGSTLGSLTPRSRATLARGSKSERSPSPNNRRPQASSVVGAPPPTNTSPSVSPNASPATSPKASHRTSTTSTSIAPAAEGKRTKLGVPKSAAAARVNNPHFHTLPGKLNLASLAQSSPNLSLEPTSTTASPPERTSPSRISSRSPRPQSVSIKPIASTTSSGRTFVEGNRATTEPRLLGTISSGLSTSAPSGVALDATSEAPQVSSTTTSTTTPATSTATIASKGSTAFKAKSRLTGFVGAAVKSTQKLTQKKLSRSTENEPAAATTTATTAKSEYSRSMSNSSDDPKYTLQSVCTTVYSQTQDWQRVIESESAKWKTNTQQFQQGSDRDNTTTATPLNELTIALQDLEQAMERVAQAAIKAGQALQMDENPATARVQDLQSRRSRGAWSGKGAALRDGVDLDELRKINDDENGNTDSSNNNNTADTKMKTSSNVVGVARPKSRSDFSANNRAPSNNDSTDDDDNNNNFDDDFSRKESKRTSSAFREGAIADNEILLAGDDDLLAGADDDDNDDNDSVDDADMRGGLVPDLARSSSGGSN